MNEIKEFKIDVIVYNEDNKYIEEEILRMFMDWTESKDLTVGGSVGSLTDKDYKEMDEE